MILVLTLACIYYSQAFSDFFHNYFDLKVQSTDLLYFNWYLYCFAWKKNPLTSVWHENLDWTTAVSPKIVKQTSGTFMQSTTEIKKYMYIYGSSSTFVFNIKNCIITVSKKRSCSDFSWKHHHHNLFCQALLRVFFLCWYLSGICLTRGS